MRPFFFKSEKRQMRGILNRWGKAWETVNFFFLSGRNLKMYSVVLVMYSWVQGFLQQYLSKYEYMYSWN